MNNESNSGAKADKAAGTFLWLLVGLAPIGIWLIVLTSRPAQRSSTLGSILFFGCVACNLLGGFGCVRNVKDVLVRIILGLFLTVFFFVLSLVIPLFQACSHMNI
jgi:hypothetical protein